MDPHTLLAAERLILLDGGMWRVLQTRGLGDEPPEAWNLTHPGEVEAVHRAYVEAGSRIVYTNTVGGSRIRLGRAGLDGAFANLNRAAAEIARRAAAGWALVAGDIGPTGELLAPYGDLTEQEARNIFSEQAKALAEAGVDLFAVETMMDLREAAVAIRGVRAVSDRPVVCTLSFGPGGRSIMGDRPEDAVRMLEALGVVAVGANCSTGVAEMLPVIAAMAKVANVPLVAKPNAGMPQLIDGRTVFPEAPAEFAAGLLALAEAGARLLGGCCGTTPEHIAGLHEILAARGLV